MPSCQAKIHFCVLNILLYNCSDFIGFVPPISAMENTGIGTKILFWIDVNYLSAFGSSIGIFTLTFTMLFFRESVVEPFDFRTNKFKSFDIGSFSFDPFQFHVKVCIKGTTGDSIFVYGV